jgi:hypothetical protein
VTVGTSNGHFSVNNTQLDRPNNIIQDADTSSNPYIDLVGLKNDIVNKSNSLSQVANTGVNVDFSDQNNRRIEYAATSGAGYYNMTASELNGISGTPLSFTGFTSGSDQGIIVNVNCAGATTISMPQEIKVFVDGNMVGRGETGDFTTGKVVFNFYNTSSDLQINATNVCCQIIAPNASLSVSNGNGNFIANNVTINGETHRTDFTGTTVPFSA